MKNMLSVVMAIFILIGGIALSDNIRGSYSAWYEGRTDGVIEKDALPDRETAVAVARTIIKNVVSPNKMESVYAMFDTDNDAWIVTFAPATTQDSVTLGDETNIVLSASDCRVLKIWSAE